MPTMTIYASADDLAAWLGETAPANAATLLRSAAIVVAAAANRDPYGDAPTGDTADALRDATTAQAAAWIANGIDPATAGLDTAPVKSKKIGTATIERDTSGQSAARTTAATAIAPEAEKILYAAGLLAAELPVWTSETDRLPSYGLPRASGLEPWSLWRNL